MSSITGIEIASDYCVLVGARRQGPSIEVTGVRVFGPPEWPSELDARLALLQESRDTLGLARRATVVAWDRPSFNMASGEAMLRQAGFTVEDILAPPDALALLAWSVSRGSGGAPIAWLSINQHGMALAVVRDFELLYTRELSWAIRASERRAQPHVLRRHLYVAQLAPELRRALDVVREQYGATIDRAITCGNIPDLRSFTPPLIEELDIEFETLDSFDGLAVQEEIAAAIPQQAAAIRLAGAVASYGQPFVATGSVLRGLGVAAGVVLAAGVVWGGWGFSSGPAVERPPAIQEDRGVVSSQGRGDSPPRPAEAIDAAEIQSPLPEPQPTTGVVLDGPTALPPLPSVAGILISSNRRLAVVNETVVGMGATVGGRVVAGIEPDAVVFREPSGRLVSVPVRPGGTGTIRKP
jgi:hypothetical protein